jgi:nitrogen regulatory protein PII
MLKFNFYPDCYYVSAFLAQGKGKRVVQSLENFPGIFNITTTTGRGTLLTKKRLFKPQISPQEDMLRLTVHKNVVDRVLKHIISEAQLYLSGTGAIYTAPMQKALFHEQDIPKETHPPKDASINFEDAHYEIQENLVSITCIVQSGKADDISKAALQLGSPGPVISFGKGKGVRDRMGVIRIAISSEKELIEVIVGAFDSDRIFESMVEAGKLDLPGMGFIYSRPIEKGIVNLPSTVDPNQAASYGQMIKAIDDLKGNTEWRSTGSLISDSKQKTRKYLSNLYNLICVCDRGEGEDAAYAAMAAGAGGATISYGKDLTHPTSRVSASGISMSHEKEMVELAIAPDNLDTILERMLATNIMDEPGKAFFYTLPVPKALTYLG